MTGLEFHRAAAGPKELHAYSSDHAMRDPQATLDRREFLIRTLGM